MLKSFDTLSASSVNDLSIDFADKIFYCLLK